MQKMQKLIFTLFIVGLLSMTACNNEEEVSPKTITANDFSASIDENAEVGELIGTFSATANQSNITAYEISSQSVAGAIALNSSTGEITVADKSAFDYETNQSITGKIKITAADAAEKEVAFSIAINDLQPDINITTNAGDGVLNILNGDTFEYGFVNNATGYAFKIQNLGEDDLNLTASPWISVSGDEYFVSISPGTNKIPAGGETSFVLNVPLSSALLQVHIGCILAM